MQSLKKQKKIKIEKIKPETLLLAKKAESKCAKMKFKVFAEDDLVWPLDSYLIQNI